MSKTDKNLVKLVDDLTQAVKDSIDYTHGEGDGAAEVWFPPDARVDAAKQAILDYRETTPRMTSPTEVPASVKVPEINDLHVELLRRLGAALSQDLKVVVHSSEREAAIGLYETLANTVRSISDGTVRVVDTKELEAMCEEFEASMTVQRDVNLANAAPAIFRRWLGDKQP